MLIERWDESTTRAAVVRFGGWLTVRVTDREMCESPAPDLMPFVWPSMVYARASQFPTHDDLVSPENGEPA